MVMTSVCVCCASEARLVLSGRVCVWDLCRAREGGNCLQRKLGGKLLGKKGREIERVSWFARYALGQVFTFPEGRGCKTLGAAVG
jgi:hypothetical protein